MHELLVCWDLAGSRITPAPYEKAQASDGICKRAAHSGSELNQKNVVVGRACACVCVHVWMHGYMDAHVREMNVRRPCWLKQWLSLHRGCLDGRSDLIV